MPKTNGCKSRILIMRAQAERIRLTTREYQIGFCGWRRAWRRGFVSGLSLDLWIKKNRMIRWVFTRSPWDKTKTLFSGSGSSFIALLGPSNKRQEYAMLLQTRSGL